MYLTDELSQAKRILFLDVVAEVLSAAGRPLVDCPLVVVHHGADVGARLARRVETLLNRTGSGFGSVESVFGGIESVLIRFELDFGSIVADFVRVDEVVFHAQAVADLVSYDLKLQFLETSNDQRLMI